MLLFCGNAQSASRTGAFIGYSEELSGVPATGSPAEGTACRDKDPSCADWASRGECTANPGYMLAACPISCKQCTPPELVRKGNPPFQPQQGVPLLSMACHILVFSQNLEMYANKTLVLKTDLGEVYITMLWDNAPRAAALIMDLAHQEGGGPPYGLLQGSLAGILKAPPSEGKAPPKYG
eukprot:scaffold1737_cov19-Tisochrysis_lutea.AAC.1